VSAESPGSSAPNDAPPAAGDNNAAGTDFGPNEWLVDELYQRYQADPGSVDRAWWNFFADYHPKPPEQPRAAGPAPASDAKFHVLDTKALFGTLPQLNHAAAVDGGEDLLSHLRLVGAHC